MLVVNAADDTGDILEGPNWGAATGDIAIPAECIDTLGFDGTIRSVAGPEVAVLAARLPEVYRGWNGERLRKETISRARHYENGQLRRVSASCA